jgi:hypothetical protein
MNMNECTHALNEMSIRVGTAKQAQMVMGLSEYELLRAQMGMGMGIPAHSVNEISLNIERAV